MNNTRGRIPPPPLLDSEIIALRGRAGISNNSHYHRSSRPRRQQEWVLCIRCHQRGSEGGHTIVKIQVYPDMSAELLCRCATQAVGSAAGGPVDPIAGLFGERDGIFYAIDQILSLPNPTSQVYGTTRIFRKKEPPKRIWTWIEWSLLAMSIVMLVARGWLGPGIWYALILHLITAQQKARYLLVDLPFSELYRYGPHVVGWEGLKLPEICARITYHGNEDFWAANMVECSRIYANKEEAFLKTTRPIAYISVLVICYLGVKSLVATYAESKRSRTDRVVVETYHAFNTLVRLGSRQLSKR